jgi:tetraacyldisaccharide 4'-kinase
MSRDYLYSLATDRKKGFIAGIIKILLFILSLIYGLAVRILSFIYGINPCRLNCKVVSIGNITLGGTGKTPLVEILAAELKQKGQRIAVLSRGYKKLATRYSLLATQYESMGDEPYMLSRNLDNIPVIVDKDRIRAAKRVIQDYQLNAVILDDGFQQWRIKKDLEIVTIDATNPLGNLHLIPRGILREPVSSLKRADIYILTKVNLSPNNQSIKEFLKRINPDALICEAVHKPIGFYKLGQLRDNLLSPEEFKRKSVGLVCGIADPESFEKIISNLEIHIAVAFKFPDHHIYTSEDLDRIISESKQKGVSVIITTEKDSVRFPTINYQLSTINYFVLRIKLEVLQYEIFIKRIHSLF